jgi:hypothetical protein
LTSGSTPFAGRSHADEHRAAVRFDGEGPVGVALHDAEHALPCDHFLAHLVRCRLALLGRHVGGLQLHAAATGT